MHGFDTAPEAEPSSLSTGPWWKELNHYHWFVLIVAALGWLFDTMDQQLFNLARVPAMRELLAPSPGISAAAKDVDFYGGVTTSIFLIGWATGGLGFGILGDRIGRAKTMLWTILLYSAFTGLSALSWDIWSFATFRFLTGLGVGGEFAVGVALVAEVMPIRARPFALGLLQALSAVGNISAALISLVLTDELVNTFYRQPEGAPPIGAWRMMFVVGALPALLAIVIRRRLKEPEQWQAASHEQLAKQLGSYSELFGDPRWKRHAIIGLVLAASGVIGLWGIGFFSFDLSRSVFRKTFESQLREAGEAEQDRDFLRMIIKNPDELKDAKAKPQPNQLLGLTGGPGKKDPEILYSAMLDRNRGSESMEPTELVASIKKGDWTDEDRSRWLSYLKDDEAPPKSQTFAEHTKRITSRAGKLGKDLGFWVAMTSIMQNLGAFFGIYAFTYLTHFVGRRPAFAVTFVLAWLSTVVVFKYLTEFSQIFWMIPTMGFFQLALFGGYAIYFPELFPTYLRSTGTSFCYNVGRYVAASGPLALGWLMATMYPKAPEPMRPAALTMSVIFLVGLLVLPFAPETKGKPLPE